MADDDNIVPFPPQGNREDEARKLLEDATQGLEGMLAVEAAEQLAQTHSKYYDTLKAAGLPDEMVKDMTYLYTQFLYNSGMMQAARALNQSATEALSAQLDEDDDPDVD